MKAGNGTAGLTGVVGIAVFGLSVIIQLFFYQIQAAKKQAKKRKDPKYFKDQQKKNANDCIQEIKKLQLSQKPQKKDKKKDITFFGVTSAGKSSLINKLFDTKLKIGVGITTSQTQMVKESENFRIWDTVGQNSDFEFFDQKRIRFFSSMDIIFILYRSTPRSSEYMIKLIWQLQDGKYQVFFVRTCCDEFNDKQHKTLDQELESDAKILKQFGVQNPIIFTASDKGGFDNDKIKKLIMK